MGMYIIIVHARPSSAAQQEVPRLAVTIRFNAILTHNRAKRMTYPRLMAENRGPWADLAAQIRTREGAPVERRF
jgi:hypothetical protein